MIEQFAYPVISLIITNPINRTILIQKRKKAEDYHGYWELPQGRLRQKETIFECASRELFEETGLTNLKLLNQFNVFEGGVFTKTMVFSIHEKISYFAIFLIGIAHGIPKETEEAYSHVWVDEAETMRILSQEKVFPLNAEMLRCYWKYYCH